MFTSKPCTLLQYSQTPVLLAITNDVLRRHSYAMTSKDVVRGASLYRDDVYRRESVND